MSVHISLAGIVWFLDAHDPAPRLFLLAFVLVLAGIGLRYCTLD
jgi:hypothetical protein